MFLTNEVHFYMSLKLHKLKSTKRTDNRGKKLFPFYTFILSTFSSSLCLDIFRQSTESKRHSYKTIFSHKPSTHGIRSCVPVVTLQESSTLLLQTKTLKSTFQLGITRSHFISFNSFVLLPKVL